MDNGWHEWEATKREAKDLHLALKHQNAPRHREEA